MPSNYQTLLIIAILVSPIIMIPDVIRVMDRKGFSDTDSIDPSGSFTEKDTIREDIPPDDVPLNPSDRQQLAYEFTSGIADPLIIERQGYYSTGTIIARTDIMEHTHQNLLIDTSNNWKGSIAEVEVTDLTTLYAVNGTFDEGIVGTNENPSTTNPAKYFPYGWEATSNTTNIEQTQRAAYDATKFIVVENEGRKEGSSGVKYTHSAGTSIVWTQTIENKPQVDNFILSFSYLYLRGVLGYANFTGDCTLNVFLDGNRVYNISLPTLANRGTWYDTGENNITIFNAPDSFELMIGLVIDETLALNAEEDYNGDSIPEGYSNTIYITAYIDNLKFISATSPSFESVDLQFHAGGESEPIVGSSGTGAAEIINPTYWVESEVPISLSANKTVTFIYESRLLSHRFSNSSYTTDISKPGVSFEVEHGVSAEVQAFSYLGSLLGYEENTLFVYHPPDWENQTILNPFLNDISSQCTFFSNYFSIPESALANLGWYEIIMESPNYAQDVDVQILDSGWVSGVIFRPGNETRPLISIQTQEEIPSTLDDVEISWYVSNGTLWYDESVSDGIDGIIQGTSKILDASQAGAWQIEIFWSNGTEIAFDIVSFDVYHTANLVPIDTTIETDSGETITGRVRYLDTDTGEYLMDTATIVGNWSTSTITFESNPARNWWDADFDTSALNEGLHKVIVNASKMYYDFISTEFYVISTKVTRLSSPNSPWSSTAWDSSILLVFNYEHYDSDTSSWNPVLNESDIVTTTNWTSGYWSVSEDITPGIFVIELDTSSNPAGTYLLNVTFSKPYYESKVILLTLIVSPAASSLIIIGEPSARVDLGEDYDIILHFAHSDGDPVIGGNVVVDSVSPPTGLSSTSVDPVVGQPGNHSVTLTPNSSGVYAIRFVATGESTEPAITVFVLVVNDVETSLLLSHSNSVEIGLTDSHNTIFRYESVNGTGIEEAEIEIIYSGNPGMLNWEWEEIGFGNYSAVFSASKSGTYLVTIAGFKQYYQSASNSFFLVVREITTNFTVLNGTAGVVSYGGEYRLVVSYTNGSGYGLAGAEISVESVVPATGLTYDAPVDETTGIYSIMLHPTTANTFTILLRASLENHQTLFALFTITATAIASSLTLLNASTSVSLDQSYTVYLLYQSETYIGLEGATLSIQNPPSGVSFSAFEDLTGGLYRITITPLEVGTYDCIFRAGLTGYQSDTVSFTLGATRIPTSLRIASGLSSDSMMYSNQYELLVFYERTDSNQNITLADINLQTSSTVGFLWSVEEVEDGYLILIDTSRTGRWTLTVTAQKTSHAVSSVQFILDVTPIPIQIEFLSSLSVIEGTNFDVTVKLTIQGTSTPVTGAAVSFRISTTGSGEFRTMEETETAGIYSARYSIPLYLSTSEYLIEVRIDKDNYELTEGTFTRPFYKNENLAVRMTPIISGSSISLALILGLVIGARMYNTRKRRRNLAALQVKKRFDDISNILGILILHKKSGLPIYSKILRGGFEEAMVSAFITAITHFRSEFGMDEKHWDFNVIPISDIISAVPTRSFIVAFITVRSPSKYQETGMEAFGRAVGAMFDEQYAEVQSEMIDEEHTHILENLFYDLLDGFLIEHYRTSRDVTFPKEMKCLESTAQQLEGSEGFRLEDLAKGMATCGIEESHAYKLVMDAIENNKLEVVNGHIPDSRISGPFIERRPVEDDEEDEY
ncbi:hypothetical protein EU527_10290 [Candidatus Thorarchaeota archaeon]|nr:MAG: hypothetical protein EU527_10290 [Candidatus Thorarchaeota archaeon]